MAESAYFFGAFFKSNTKERQIKMKKRIMAIIASAALCLGLCGCKKSSDTDWDYIKNKGELVVGITYNMPMNYNDDNGELTGFETEFTNAVCEKLDVKPKFQVIEWSKKEMELKSKTIDLVWNGLTVTEDRKKEFLFSKSYMSNKQVTVVKKENAEKYPDAASMSSLKIAFEGGSAGEDIIKATDALKNVDKNSMTAQKDALMEVKAGTSDACIVDYTLAKAFTKEGSDYDDLTVLDNLGSKSEEYAIGARLEDKETIEKINGAIDELAKDGTLKKIAEKYDLADALLV